MSRIFPISWTLDPDQNTLKNPCNYIYLRALVSIKVFKMAEVPMLIAVHEKIWIMNEIELWAFKETAEWWLNFMFYTSK